MKESILKNPIFEIVYSSFKQSNNQLLLAVPFLNSYAKSILNIEHITTIKSKRLITRFEDKTLLSFDIPTLEFFLDLGFEIRYNNDIHLKLYITDDDAFVTSSNLTKSGFEDKIELTVKVAQSNKAECLEIFNEIWSNCESNIIDIDILKENFPKYKVLKRKEDFKIEGKTPNPTLDYVAKQYNNQKIIDAILTAKIDYSETILKVHKARKTRETKLTELKNGFTKELFYLPVGNPKRRDTLFYDFIYGHEVDLAGTGLREEHFRKACEDPKLREAIEFMYPEIVGLKNWNLNDEEELLRFCKGIFDFKIPCYKETLPIRLASYFYPGSFLPIFKLDHLSNICSDLGFVSNKTDNGTRLFEYNCFLAKQLENVPYDNFIKSHIFYLIHYTLELHARRSGGEDVSEIILGHNKKWKKNLADHGLRILKEMELSDEALPTTNAETLG